MSELIGAAHGLTALKERARPKRRLNWVIGLCFFAIGVMVVLAIFGQFIAPQNPSAQNMTIGLTKPSLAHWFGTDALGRDVFSRVIIGARSALLGPFVIALGAMLCGNLLGLVAGYAGGKVDSLLMRWVDLMWSLPGLLVIIVVAGALGGGYWFSVGLLTFLTVPFDARLIRGATLEQVPRPYVEAAKTLGVSNFRIMVFHIWPNVSPITFATTFLQFATALVSLAGLSFLGLGVAPGTPDWGLMVAEGRSLLFANPVAVLGPGAMIVLAATAMNLIGDWLLDYLIARGATR